MSANLIRTAHGAGTSSLLRVEAPALDEITNTTSNDTVNGLAVAKFNGRPFVKGNKAAQDRGPSLTRGGVDPDAPESRRAIERKASSLKLRRMREMKVAHGGYLSTAVLTELVAWSRAVAWADHYYRIGDANKGAAIADKASTHQLRAIAIAEREMAARPKAPFDPLAAFR
jgi:hypothetical protein